MSNDHEEKTEKMLRAVRKATRGNDNGRQGFTALASEIYAARNGLPKSQAADIHDDVDEEEDAAAFAAMHYYDDDDDDADD